MKYFAELSVEKLKIGGSFDLVGWKKNMFYFQPTDKKYRNLPKIGVHTPNCCLKKWAEE